MSQVKEKKGVSVIDFFCIGFGAIVGVGWAVSINGWMSGSGGPVPAAIGYLVALIMMVPIGLCYCELVPALPVAGGALAFAFRAFNSKVAVISGWATLGTFVSIIPWEAIQITDILSYLIPSLTAGDPLYKLGGTGIYPSSIIIGTVCSVLMFILNMRGLAAAAVAQKILCFVLVGAALIGAAAAFLGGSPENLKPYYDVTNPAIYGPASEGFKSVTHNSMFGGIIAILATVPFFLAGFETIPQGVEDAGGDIGSVGKTVVLSIFLACVFYALLLFAFGFAWKWEEFAQLVAVGGVMSLIGPFLGAGLIQDMTSFTGETAVLAWMLTCYSLVALRKREPDLERPYKIPGGMAMGIFASVVTTVVFVLLFIPGSPPYVGPLAIKMFFGWMIIGLILYLASAGQRKGMTEKDLRAGVFAGMEERKATHTKHG